LIKILTEPVVHKCLELMVFYLILSLIAQIYAAAKILRKQSNERGIRPSSCLKPNSSVCSIKAIEVDIEPSASVDTRIPSTKTEKHLYKPLTHQNTLTKNQIRDLKETSIKDNSKLSDLVSPPKRAKSKSGNVSTTRRRKDNNSKFG
jgi:hypothetical protein